MMQTGYSLRFADYARMNESERTDALNRLTREGKAPPTAERIAELDKRIAEYEARHAMSTESMLARLKAGEIPETEEIAAWLFYYDLRGKASMPTPP